MSRFSDYLQKTFDFSSMQAEEIIAAMIKPIGKSIRINTQKISLVDFKIHAKEQGWTLTDTDIPEVFLIDRDDTSLALGRTLEHTAGWFYIQEVAAAMPPHLLRREVAKKREKRKEKRDGFMNNWEDLHWTLNIEHWTFLDMCASPGGKTTQLADYFPDSLIIANEVNRTRTPQLFDNLDRMGYANVAVVSCDGRFFQNFPDFFDAVLLDAPCSGEGTAFRDSSVIDHWHEKNIDRIAKLQKQLFETAETIVAPGGVVSYSTCTLNVMENEEVIESVNKTWEKDNRKRKTEDHKEDWVTSQQYCLSNLTHEAFGKLECKYAKRFWPHIEHTGGFFASIFQKVSETPFLKGDGKSEWNEGDFGSENPQPRSSAAPSRRSYDYPVLAAQGQKNAIVRALTKGEQETVDRFVAKHLKTKLKSGFLYIQKDGIYFNRRNLWPLAQHFYFVHAGARIGSIKWNTFTPTQHLWWYVTDTSKVPEIILTPADWIAIQDSKPPAFKEVDGWYTVRYGRGVYGLGSLVKGKIILS
jgi:16S rRNA C967 or C1407 C5-methylase (RsmB/RsmF family)